MADAPQLPELARSLRTLGAAADANGEAAQQAVFLPLLEARTRASGAPVDAVLAALRGDALAARIAAQAADAAVQGIEQPALIRARAAQAAELVEPLRVELLALDDLVPGARDGGEGCERWVAQLRRAFTAADV
ncbi:MAG: hypothetical protein ABJA80_07690, partial [bacterium]